MLLCLMNAVLVLMGVLLLTVVRSRLLNIWLKTVLMTVLKEIYSS